MSMDVDKNLRDFSNSDPTDVERAMYRNYKFGCAGIFSDMLEVVRNIEMEDCPNE